MKNKNTFKKIIAILIFSFYLQIHSQVSIKMINMEYENIQTSECNRVDLKSQNNHNLTFNVILEKQYDSFNTNNINDLYANGDIEIILGALGTQSTKEITDIKRNMWVIDANNGVMRINIPYNIPINNNEININQNNIFAIYDTGIGGFIWDSCKYAITKPIFTLSPSSTDISCNTTSKTFTVENVNNSPGTISFKWQVGNSWFHNGSPAPNEIITSLNHITLFPRTSSLDKIKVTPILDGVSFPILTSNVNLTPIENKAITGDFTVCSSEMLSIDNLNSNETVIWASSNTNIASINTSNNQAIVYANGTNGIVTITATITNSCGQQLILTKTVTIGIPNDYLNGQIEVHPWNGPSGGLYLQNWTRMHITNISHLTYNNWEWTANYSMLRNSTTSQILIKPLSTGYMTIKARKNNKCGNGNWISKNFYVTEQSDGGHHFRKN